MENIQSQMVSNNQRIQNLQEKTGFEELKDEVIENFQTYIDAIEDLREAEIVIKSEMSQIKMEMEEFKIWKEEHLQPIKNSEEFNEQDFTFN